MEINKEILQKNLIFDLPVVYDDNITLYPVRMKDSLDFQVFQLAITARKDSIFQRKDVIKMGYWDFIKETAISPDNFQSKDLPLVSFYYSFILTMLPKICEKDANIECNTSTLDVYINGELITNEIFDDMRRIIILQNDIDFNIDEFMNIDTVKALERARDFEAKKNKETSDIAHGIHMAIAAKAISLMRRVGLEPRFMMTGGVAKNPGVVKVLEEQLKAPLFISEEPEIVGALGAALYGLENIL